MQRWIQQPSDIIVIICSQVIPVFQYVIIYLADKELSGIDVHHSISKFTRRSAAHNTGQLDSNAGFSILPSSRFQGE